MHNHEQPPEYLAFLHMVSGTCKAPLRLIFISFHGPRDSGVMGQILLVQEELCDLLAGRIPHHCSALSRVLCDLQKSCLERELRE